MAARVPHDARRDMNDAAVRVRSPAETAGEEYDVFKHSLLRYFGYANELGESFRPLVHSRWVAFSYLVAGTYVAADTGDKYLKAQRMENYTAQQRRMLGASNAIDTAIWQGLASVAIPGKHALHSPLIGGQSPRLCCCPVC